MASPLPLALVQAAAHPADAFDSFASGLERLVRQRDAVRLFVFPELHLNTTAPGAGPGDGAALPEDLAEPLDGARDRRLAELAADLGVWLMPGSFYERGGGDRIHNTAPVYSPAGRRVAAYRKICPWRPYETTAPGNEFVVFDMGEYGRVGMSICYDAWFPEISRNLAHLGAQLIVNLVQTPTSDREQEVVLARANAITNQVFVASVNAATPTGLGRSLLVDPEGRVRTQAVGAEACVLTDVIDLAETDRVRRYGTAGLNRVWDQFQPGDAPVDLPLYSGRIDPDTWGTRRLAHAPQETAEQS
ncbi:carbon-nitrogen hydrolase family protein [Streptomyces sp. TG1A-8]|uniref:carbon-nitrogen hydrolase family protein n=1 Tax=Streptomyces sp. TG1A-8 TaxID=3051385 RepID=UPI00265C4F67|nr:carbon-nitrogen hydrolase family protein [Streptomyces sp. TG1A-8]MDO0929366.1 carbon-nitrogen hydrolase family protein [Streptomyces sp. TG1A-8]